ncbi:MAG TPA: hypothetical protein VEG30_09215, partial [Terriglobales bacterium]|nr:hypothetical protein [Terriglobales bacterium]
APANYDFAQHLLEGRLRKWRVSKIVRAAMFAFRSYSRRFAGLPASGEFGDGLHRAEAGTVPMI